MPIRIFTMIMSLGFMICPPPGLTSTEKKREYRINWLFQADLCQSFYSKERCSHSLPRVHIPRTARGSSLWEISAGEHSTMILPLYTNFLLYLFVHFLILSILGHTVTLKYTRLTNQVSFAWILFHGTYFNCF